MADGVEGFLTRKLGPLPLWAYLGVGGGAVLLFVLYRRGASATNGTQTASALGTSPGQPVIVNPPPTSPTNPPTSTTGTGVATATITGNPAGIWSAPNTQSKQIALLQQGTSVQITGPPVQGETWGGVSYWYPVSAAGQPGYVAGALLNLQMPSGMGSGSSLALFGDGRHANPATMLGPHIATQYVRMPSGMGGGPGRHGATGRTGGHNTGTVGAVHAATRIPALRLLSLNPQLWRPGTRRSATVRLG